VECLRCGSWPLLDCKQSIVACVLGAAHGLYVRRGSCVGTPSMYMRQLEVIHEHSSVHDMTSWHPGLFSSLERWTSRDQRQQGRSLWSDWDVVPGRCFAVSRALLHVFWEMRMMCIFRR
jgi:hypothetical protein